MTAITPATTVLIATVVGSLRRSAAQLRDVGERTQDYRVSDVAARVCAIASELSAVITPDGRDQRYDYDDEC